MRAIEQTAILITGATDGLGRAIAVDLAGRGATVHLHGRDRLRLQAVRDQIVATTGNDRLHTHVADLASLAQVRALADGVSASTDALHVLISNAGLGSGKPDLGTRQQSADGYELRFAVNYLAGFLLSLRLLPLLKRSVPARIVNVASLGQAPVDFDDVMIEHGYSGGRAYGQSKLAQIISGIELSERLSGTGVTVNSLHPSTYMPTKIVLEQVGHSIDTLERGVAATIRLAIDPELEGVTGRFFDREQEARADPQACDPEARRRLWELSLKLVGEPDAG